MAEKRCDTLVSKKEANGMVMVNKQIKDCSYSNLFSFLNSHFSSFFLDLQELRDFISYLQEKKSKMIVKDILDNFKDIVKNFKEGK